jgi:hypothetical protein
VSGQPRVFVSYARADAAWLKEFEPHLKGLVRHAGIESFDDTQLLGGDSWDERIKAELDQADLVLLLVTANFTASDYIHRVELPAAIARRKNDGCIVIPVLIDACYRKPLGIEDVNYLPKDGGGALVPVSSRPKGKRAPIWAGIVEHIHKQIERRQAEKTRDETTVRTTGIDLAIYRQRAKAQWAAIDLFALAAPGAADAEITIRLSDVFIPQSVRPNRPAMSLPRDYMALQGLDADAEDRRAVQARGWEQQPPVPALDLIVRTDQRLLVLLGDPGAGKSALARHVLLQLLDDASDGESPLAPLRGHVPFLIELRDFVARETERRCTDLLSYLAFSGQHLGFGFDEAALRHQLAARPSLLIVDGLDEIFDPSRRRLMVQHIVGLAGDFPKLRVLVTSRIAGFDEQPLRAAGFAIATLVDLTPQQIERFAGAWFPLVFPADEAAAERARDDLLETLKRRPQLRVIAGNPMILTIMATVARHKRLGRSRAALYSQALELLCYGWDYRRLLKLPKDSPLIDLQPEDTLLMLRRVAWRMQESVDGLRANAIAETDLRTVLEAFFLDDWKFTPPRARRAVVEMLQRLQERNWVLTLRGPSLFGFVHRTFLEYLCAVEIAEQFKAQNLVAETLITRYVVPHVSDDSWHEVLRLLVGALPPVVAEQVICAIVPTNADVVDDASRLAFAWQCLAEVEPRTIPSLVRACGRLTDSLYVWLAESRNHDAGPGSQIIDAAATMGPLGWPVSHPPERLWPACSTYLRYSHPDVLTGLCLSVWDCPETAYGWLMATLADLHSKNRGPCLRALAEHFRGATETITLLRARAVDDPDAFCRREALKALAGHFRDASETVALLRARAVDDPDAFCRREALKALAGHFRDASETVTLLRARAADDPDEDCRSAALRSLAGHCFRDAPETFTLLRARAVDDPAEDCRRVALRSLAEHFHDAPETVTLLHARAVDDPGEDCRRVAVQALIGHFPDAPETVTLLRTRAVDDLDAFCRQEALELLAGHFRDAPETVTVLRARAVNDPGEGCRIVALQALAEYFRDAPETVTLLRARAVDDQYEGCRREAFISIGLSLGDTHAILASRDLDGLGPGRDPHDPITPDDIAAAARKLRRTQDEVRALYRRLAELVPLRFADEPTASPPKRPRA